MTLEIVAQQGNLRCSWPRVGTVVTHAATFTQACAWPRTRAVNTSKMLAFMRREAIAGRNYAFGHGYHDDHGVAMDVDRRIVPQALPAHQRPAPVERKDSPLVSKYGKRLPLRALPWRELNRRFWSRGEVVFADSLERNQARELTAFEKTANPETMTLDELVATQSLEPISESRRSWLERGMGVFSLEGAQQEWVEGSIGEMLAAKGQIDAIEAAGQSDFADEASSIGRGVAYVTVDPITAKQIAWEQERWHQSPAFSVGLKPSEKGGLTMTFGQKIADPDALKRVAISVKRTLVSRLGEIPVSMDDLAERVAQLRTQPFFDMSADPDEERERYLAPADDEWHASYVKVQPTVAVLSDVECMGDFCETEDCTPCYRKTCTDLRCHRHIRLEKRIHRSPRRSPESEFWHTELFDVTAFELGTDGLVERLAVSW